ncbi:MAG: SdrD B-like domain-containing protein [Caldilineaceae bacterium]
MTTQFVRLAVIVALQVTLFAQITVGAFASEPIFTPITSGITGRVWLDTNGSGNFDQQETLLAEIPVFIQRLDLPETDVVMTLVVYTDNVGGYSFADLEPGIYQIWTEVEGDQLFNLVLTITENTPTATADLPMIGYQVFMPTVMR